MLFSHKLPKTFCRRPVFLLLLLLLMLPGPSAALGENDATLRNYKLGEQLPAFQLPLINERQKVNISPGRQNKPAVIMFFSIRPDFRKKRSLALLSILSDLAEQYKNRIDLMGIYCDDRDGSVVHDYIQRSAIRIPVYADSQKEVHNRYGVFMMPLIILVGPSGTLHEVIPYTYNIRELVDGNIKLLLGEWTKEQFLKSLEPEPQVPKTEEEKEYIRRINYGRIMKSKKMYPQAIREFSTAIKLQPKATEAYAELGFLQLTIKEWDAALDNFQKLLAMDPDSDDAIAGLGLAHYGKDAIDQALTELENAFIAPEPKLEVIIALAQIYEKRGDYTKANRMNKLAVSKLMALYEQRWQ